ncbi:MULTISPECIES: TonB-dependent siderophore receptor [unclassified Lentimonas]|uniref:TonB-dependent receptor n=1 Tax=unclassified Lentimonas TaxID=2630993 RepID=UPI00132A874A|nr:MULTISPECIES: TonB-dependent receptor [unclassified Lentimonas]CAA6679436.1 Unannotated [Lentimonas sp. CC4]CAA6687107.1 Unannotated [Lentimonas sp. CC6]CAA7075546.1 Unannotated [Lentimonas sp. CC4]CAA7170313.1 Unannotated [Lentimonas sp. CC21]CAA7182607.1 Unannotated [Lentimonas sp. CC8]
MTIRPITPTGLWFYYLCLPLTSILAEESIQQTDEAEMETTVLEDYIVYAPIPLEENVLPTARPVNSVYGSDMSVLDTPRNITIISREQLDAISIRDPRDFAKLTTSSYTGSNFGAPTTPSIRGQIADTLVNGMRKGMSNNGNGMPLNFNSVESVSILKGPPSVMIGVSQYVGGYVDLITKRPTFDDNYGYATATVDSEGMQQLEIDQNIAISETLAVRFSITGEDSTDYYWDDYKRQTTAIYGALTWAPNENYQLDVNGEYFNANYTENWGINRPTDDLLDHGTYVTGKGTTFGFGDSLTTDGTTKIDRETRLHGDGDDSNGDYFSLQAIQTFTADPDVTIVNNSLFQYCDRDTFSSYQYTELLRDNYRFENRTELRTEAEFLNLLHKFNVGLSFSYQDVWAVNDYYHEPANAWDLSRPYSEVGLTDPEVFYTGGFYNAFPVHGQSGRGKLSGFPGSNSSDYFISGTGDFVLGNNDSNDSQISTAGLFIEDEINLTEQLILLVGGRLDFVHVESEDPMFGDMIRYLQRENPGNDYSGVEKAKDSHDDFIPNFNVGLVYKLTPTQSLYANYNYSESIPSDLGGGIALKNGGENNGKIDGDKFDRKSELVEGGFKATFLDNTLFYSADVFYQTRTDTQSRGEDIKVQITGFETEVAYQATPKFYVVAGYSYIESISKNGQSATQAPISSVNSNGGVYAYDTFYTFDGYDARTPGVPRSIINGLVAYKLTDNLSATCGILITSPMDLGFNVPAEHVAGGTGPKLDSIEIPWQYSIDLGMKYETARWAISLKMLNATDEENWGAVNSLYGNDSVYAELPRRYELAATIKW